MLRTLAILTLFLGFLGPSWAAPVPSKKGERGKVDVDLEYREYMLTITRQLGVTCAYCHDPKNFKSDKLEAFKISRDHIKMVDLLNRQPYLKKAGQKVTCYTCHRGEAKYQFAEKPLEKPGN